MFMISCPIKSADWISENLAQPNSEIGKRAVHDKERIWQSILFTWLKINLATTGMISLITKDN